MTNNQRIAKNTIILYGRMIITMAVALYTSRVILDVLGDIDFGVYSLVGGIIVIFEVMNGAMSMSTQRYLNFSMGRNEAAQTTNIFTSALLIHIGIGLFAILLGETIGLWYFNNYLIIPTGRETAAMWVYQITLITSSVYCIRTPYNAAIIATERMNFYAYISIIEVILKLVIVFALLLTAKDHLIVYSILLLMVAIISTLSYYLYCTHTYPLFRFKFHTKKKLYKQLLNFSWWTLFGSTADMVSMQGLHLLFNFFTHNILINTAMGLTTRVTFAVLSLIQNFQIAFRPQIVKDYAVGDREGLIKLVCQTSRQSFLLLFIFVLPYIFSANFIIYLWFHKIPEYVVPFTILLLINLLIEAISAPLWMTALAAGNVRNYYLLISSMILMIIPISSLILWTGIAPQWVLATKIGLTCICHILRLLYLKRRIQFPVRRYLKDTVPNIFFTILIAVPIAILLTSTIGGNTLMNFVRLGTTFMTTLFIVFAVGLKTNEKIYAKQLILQKIRKQYNA